MSSLRKALDVDEPALAQIDSVQGSILTKSGDWEFHGSISSTASLSLSPSTNVRIGNVRPHLEYPEGTLHQPVS